MAQKANNKSGKATAKPAQKNTGNVKKQTEADSRMPLSWKNYRLMLIGLAVIIIGFILMAGPKNTDPNVFDWSMFNFRRITLAPILVLGGFAFEIYAIMKRFDKKKDEE